MCSTVDWTVGGVTTPIRRAAFAVACAAATREGDIACPVFSGYRESCSCVGGYKAVNACHTAVLHKNRWIFAGIVPA